MKPNELIARPGVGALEKYRYLYGSGIAEQTARLSRPYANLPTPFRWFVREKKANAYRALPNAIFGGGAMMLHIRRDGAIKLDV